MTVLLSKPRRHLAILFIVVATTMAILPVGFNDLSGRRQAENDLKLACVPIADRWPSFAASGPSDGPVQMVLRDSYGPLGTEVNEVAIKLLILLDFSSLDGQVVTVYGSGPGEVRFTHGGSSTSLASATSEAQLDGSTRSSRVGGPVDFPGYIYFGEAGYYRLWVAAPDGSRWGPFCTELFV